MKTSHTQGPWRIMQCLPKVQEYDGQTETVIVDENNRNILNRGDLLEEAANALVLAAAPELLEALTRSLVFIQNIQLEAHRDIETGELISRMTVLYQARAAIAKAAL